MEKGKYHIDNITEDDIIQIETDEERKQVLRIADEAQYRWGDAFDFLSLVGNEKIKFLNIKCSWYIKVDTEIDDYLRIISAKDFIKDNPLKEKNEDLNYILIPHPITIKPEKIGSYRTNLGMLWFNGKYWETLKGEQPNVWYEQINITDKNMLTGLRLLINGEFGA